MYFNNTNWDTRGVLLSETSKQHKLAYDISFQKMPSKDEVMYVHTAETSALSADGFDIVLKRKTRPYMLNIYMPTTALVIISWIAFLIPPDMVPGRMGLLVTVFLVLSNIATGTRALSPDSGSLTVVDIWLLACTAFVAVALCEYALILYSKFSKQRKLETIKRVTILPLHLVKNTSTSNESNKSKLSLNKMDKIALIAAPVTFALFVILYIIII